MVRSSNGQPAAASANATDPMLEIMMERLSIKGPDIPGLEEDALTDRVREISLNIFNASANSPTVAAKARASSHSTSSSSTSLPNLRQPGLKMLCRRPKGTA